MYEEEYQQIKDILHRLQADSNSKLVFLVDKNGQQIAAQGDMRGVDATSLASLTAGNFAATDGLAKLIGETMMMKKAPTLNSLPAVPAIISRPSAAIATPNPCARVGISRNTSAANATVNSA